MQPKIRSPWSFPKKKCGVPHVGNEMLSFTYAILPRYAGAIAVLLHLLRSDVKIKKNPAMLSEHYC